MGTLSVPLKSIIMYHADTTNEPIPSSYEACDGRLLGIGTHDIGGGTSTYQLPDLRNRFILGADITKGVGVTGGLTDAAADAPGPKATSGANSASLSIGNLPAHSHTVTGTPSLTGTPSITDPGHTHGGGNYLHSGGIASVSVGAAYDANPIPSATTGITVGIGSLVAGIGSLGTANTGAGTALDIRPRYYGLVFLMKVRL